MMMVAPCPSSERSTPANVLPGASAHRNLRHAGDGKLARDCALEVCDLESASLRELGVTALLPDKSERYDSVGERHLFVNGVLLRQ
jgi:hypothetical protein